MPRLSFRARRRIVRLLRGAPWRPLALAVPLWLAAFALARPLPPLGDACAAAGLAALGVGWARGVRAVRAK